MADPVALAAIAIDVAIGWPAGLYARIGHPVGAIARAIDVGERVGNRPRFHPAWRLVAGVATILVVVGGVVALAVGVERACRSLGVWGWLAIAACAWPALALRSLAEHVRPVAAALRRGDLANARQAVARIVGRDTATLDEAGVARAAIESLAESFCDGVVAPMFWLVLLGLPGVWGYKAINTADSLIGHREERWRAFGWAAARIDDGANWIPARLAGCLICLAGGGGWRTLARDHAAHASPNAGWPEAAMAGALGVALAGPVAYDGVVQAKPWIGGDGRPAGAADVRRALRIYARACVMLALLAGAVAWRR